MNIQHYDSSFKIQDSILARIAAAPYEHYACWSIQEWLNDPMFRNSLLLASDSLYKDLEKGGFNMQQLPTAALKSIRKYTNRITKRTTPFGAFAGFLLTQFSTGSIQLKEDFNLYLQNDFGDILAAYNQRLGDNNAYQTNSTLYHLSTATRFIGTHISNTGLTSFRLHTVAKDKLLRDLTEHCREKRSKRNILQFLYRAGLDYNDSLLFLHDLVTEKILLPETYPLITTNHFEGHTLTRQQLLESARNSKEYPFPRQQWYANLQLQSSGGVSDNVKNDLKDALYALRRLSIPGSLPDLSAFKTKFVERFGERAVPLMEALDPELGIAYAGLAKTTRGMALLDGLDPIQTPDPPPQIPWGAVQQLLLKKWPQLPGGSIELDYVDLASLKENNDKLPPSLSILFRYEEGKVWLDNCGGCSAIQIAGRFSSFSFGLKKVLQDIAAKENSANPGIIFAEIASFSEGRIDNVSRRAVLRQYEIPVNTASSLPNEQQLNPSSLMIAVVNNEIIVWSAKLGKRIIPRLSSAYNYRRSTLSLLRFLGDIQYQGIQHQWTTDPAILFPGLNWYPRISYCNVILSPATWMLDAVELKKNIDSGIEHFRAFAESLSLPRHVAAGEGDRFLSLDLHNPEDVVLLAAENSRQGRIVLRESPLINNTGGTVTNQQGQSHAAQFNAFVMTAAPVYAAYASFPSSMSQKIVLPGHPWLYYKLYLPTTNSHQFLVKLAPVIHSLLSAGHISEWHFVRYLDPSPHLRLRLKISENELDVTIRTLSALFEKVILSGQLHRMILEPYQPEHERYFEIGMPLTETIFTASSNVVLAAFRQASFQHHTFAIWSTYHSLKQLIPDDLERLKLIENIRDQLLKELGAGNNLKKGLEQKKREMRRITAIAIENKDLYRSQRYKQAVKRYMRLLSELPKTNGYHLQLSADLCHMHINRSFPADMRRQELVLYTLLHQYELTMLKKVTF